MKLNIVTANYFDGIFYRLGMLMFALAIYLIAVDVLVAGIILGAVSLIIFTSKMRLLIDTEKKFYKEYTWIAGFEKGDKVHYDKLGVVAVKPEKYVQRIKTFVSNKEMRFTVYAVYIHLDNEPVFAGEFKKKEKADEKAKTLSEKLGTGCYL
jgi:hypothetical protein